VVKEPHKLLRGTGSRQCQNVNCPKPLANRQTPDKLLQRATAAGNLGHQLCQAVEQQAIKPGPLSHPQHSRPSAR
jgi:hypothetical protein